MRDQELQQTMFRKRNPGTRFDVLSLAAGLFLLAAVLTAAGNSFAQRKHRTALSSKTQAASPDGKRTADRNSLACTPAAIAFGQSVNGALDTSDCVDGNFYYDVYTFEGLVGQQVGIALNSASFDAMLLMADSSNTVIGGDDNGGGGTNSRIPADSGTITLPRTGVYQIVVATANSGARGAYTLTLNGGSRCGFVPIALGETKSGTMDSSCSDIAGYNSQYFVLNVQAGQKLSIKMTSSSFDPYLFIQDDRGNPLASDDDGGGGQNARIPSGDGYLQLQNTGTYLIVATTAEPSATGEFKVSVVNENSAAPFDFDGDGKTDIGIFRPVGASGGAEWWYVRSSDSSSRAIQFGLSTDVLVPGDFTGDGKADIAFWRPSSGQWFVVRSEDNSFFAFPFGGEGDVPAPADYDGDGKTDAAVFRASQNAWYILRSSDAQVTVATFGAVGDKPVSADYDGDGKADIAVFRPNGTSGGAEWWYVRSSDGTSRAVQFGVSTDKAVPADYTGDGKADIAFWRPSSGEWFVIRSEDNSYFAFPFGAAGDVVAPGDYDGDGKADPTVFRPSQGVWYSNRTSSGMTVVQFGAAGDRPVANAYVR